MRKLIIQGTGMVAVFLFTWFALSEVNWMSIFKVEKLTKATEQKLGKTIWDWFNHSEKEIKDSEIFNTVDSLLTRVCASNDIYRDQVELHIVSNAEVNAFALPGNHLVLYSGLINSAENESELSGVIAHELAHIEMEHVMKKLVKEVGLSVLISMSTGNSGGEIVKEAAKLLSSTAYDRKLEKEADLRAVDYLINAGIEPIHFASFLSRLSETQPDIETHLEWISTHPESQRRADYINSYREGKPLEEVPFLANGTWMRLKEYLNNLDDNF